MAVLLLLGLGVMCLGLLALLRFRAAGSVLINLQLQRLLVVLGVALTGGGSGGGGAVATAAAGGGVSSEARRLIRPRTSSVGLLQKGPV